MNKYRKRNCWECLMITFMWRTGDTMEFGGWVKEIPCPLEIRSILSKYSSQTLY